MNIREQFDQFVKECEKFSGSNESNHIVINLSGSEQQKELFQKLVKIYELELSVDMTIAGFSDKEINFRKETLEIMKHSMYYFKVTYKAEKGK